MCNARGTDTIYVCPCKKLIEFANQNQKLNGNIFSVDKDPELLIWADKLLIKQEEYKMKFLLIFLTLMLIIL